MVFVKQPIKFLTITIAGLLLTSGFALSIFANSPHGAAHASGVNSDQNFYVQTNLVSNLPNIARVQDQNLVNSWGLAHSSAGSWMVADNGKGVVTAYEGSGKPFPESSPLVITIPPPSSTPGATAAPTGIVFNNVNQTNPDDFVVRENGKSGPSIFLFATEDGTISGWNPKVDSTHAILKVDRSTVGLGAVYKGLAIGRSNNQDFIYATNFRFGTVEMFDAHFKLMRSFSDPQPPLGPQCSSTNVCFAPFGIQNIGGKLFVTFALQKQDKHDDQAGAGNGFVDVFDTQGTLLRRFASGGKLNSPWGLALAPNDFGNFSNDLLVGNFGDGHINAFNPDTGAFIDQIRDQDGVPFTINGLWGIAFGNGGLAGEQDELFFASGLNDEKDGLFGKIQVVTDNS